MSIRRERSLIHAVTRTADIARVEGTRLASATARRVTFFAPFDDIDTRRSEETRRRPHRVRRQRWPAELRGLQAHAAHVSLPLAAVTARIDVLPYQLEPLLALRAGHRRVLVADAVGLGKTIQAGLVIAELLRRREASRVIVATPGHLCRQWRDELRARFDIHARPADASTLKTLAAALPRHTHPWSLDAVWIGSLDFLKQPHVLMSLTLVPWDLVIIDEAHSATNHSERRVAAEALTTASRRVLLLSATPLSGLDDGRALTRMGALASTEPLVVFRRQRNDVTLPSHRRTRTLRVTPSPAERHGLDVLDAFARAATRAASSGTADATHLLVSVLQKRALSTFDALLRSVDRRLAHLSGVPLELADATQPSFDFGDEDEDALRGVIGLPVDRERSWMRRLRTAAAAAAPASGKIRRLARLLSRTQDTAIVFTEFRDSLNVVFGALHHTHRVVIAHGGQSAGERDHALDAFRSGDARILIATDVASQGLNLQQRSHWVIHLDLPWNPMRLEQRAGRVDRLGQLRDVHVTQLVLAHDRDRAFSARLASRASRAEHHTALRSDTRWRRPARAAARAIGWRRALAATWRGPARRGRPLACAGADAVDVHHIGGVEDIVTTAAGAARVTARARRVARIEAARALCALAVERALLARSAAPIARARATGSVSDPRQRALPGALTADDARGERGRAASAALAREAMRVRVEMLDARARAVTLTATVSRRLQGHD